MENLATRVKEKRKELGLSQSALAGLVGVAQQAIQKVETGKTREPRFIVALAAALKTTPEALAGVSSLGRNNTNEIPIHHIRVEGVSHAGRFEDISLIADDEFSREVITAPKDDRFPHAHQYALKVSGDSMNLRYPDGGYVICAAWNETGLEFRDGLAVHVERVRFASERETTIKIYREIDGKPWLYPDSTNKNHLPIEINGDPDIEIIVKGIILATYSKQVI